MPNISFCQDGRRNIFVHISMVALGKIFLLLQLTKEFADKKYIYCALVQYSSLKNNKLILIYSDLFVLLLIRLSFNLNIK